jgi:hypothetical protein
MSVTIGIDGEREYQVALYFVDWNRNGCRQAVEMMDAGTLNQVAPVKIVDDFSGGAYLMRIPTQIGQGSDVKADGVPMQSGHRSD